MMVSNKKSMLDKIINLALNIVLVIFGILLVISIYNNIQTHILGNSYSSFFGYSTFEVKTGSMEDTISIGDWIIVKSSNKIKLDDIITYEKDGEFITHRVIESYKDTYVTKGDANNTKDDPITSDKIVGKVVTILPGFGIVRKILLNPLVLIAIMVTLWLISYTLKSHKKNRIKKQINKTEDIESLPKIEQIENENEFEDYSASLDEIELDDEEELEKTMYFRMISVDKNDIGEKVKKPKEPSAKKEVKKEKAENKGEEKKDTKKFNNIVEKVMHIKKSELLEIIDALNNHAELKTNEKAIRDALLSDYLNKKYYTKDEEEKNGRNTLTKTNNYIKAMGNSLIESYKGSDKLYEQKVQKFISILMIVNYLELTFPMINKVSEKKIAYINKLKKSLKIDLLDSELKIIVDDIIKIQKEYDNLIKENIKGQSSSVFKLELKRIVPKKNYFQAYLDHNIEFSSVYSEYIVDKTYSEGKIAEEKSIILTNLLLTKIVDNMLDNNLNDKYFIELPSSIYEKNNKLGKVLNMLKDEYIKESITIITNYNTLSKYKKVIKSLRKDGYKFAIFLDEEVKDPKDLALINNIFMTKETIKKIKSLPEDVKQNIIEIGGR